MENQQKKSSHRQEAGSNKQKAQMDSNETAWRE